MSDYRIIAILLATSAVTLSSCVQEDVEKKPVPTSKKNELDTILIGIPKKSLTEAVSEYTPNPGRDYDAADYLQAAEKALKKPDYESAETLLTQTIKLSPNNSRAYLLRGRCRCNAISGKDALAIKDLHKAISLGERSKNTYEYLARLHHDRKEHADTIATLEEALKLYPMEGEYYELLGAVYVELGKNEKAKESYNLAVKVDPKHAKTYFIRAQFLQSLKEYEAALKDYKSVVKLEHKNEKVPKKGAAYRCEAELLGKLGRHKEAIAVLNDAIGSDKADEDLLRLRGEEYASLKMFDKAIADYSAAIDMSPEYSSRTYEARGKAYATIGKSDLAKQDLAEAKRLLDKPAEKTLFKMQ